jgi:hypothetical protein
LVRCPAKQPGKKVITRPEHHFGPIAEICPMLR